MTTGIPPAFTDIVERVCDQFPRSRKYIQKIYKKYLTQYMWYVEKWHCIEGPHVGIDNSQLLYVNPKKITKANDPGFYFHLDSSCKVVSGNWDRGLPQFEDIFPYSAFEEHFLDNKDWEETEMYPFLKRMFDAERSMGGYTSLFEAKRRLKEIDNLFDNIQKNGYQTQRELLSNQEKDPIGTPEWLSGKPPEHHEIAINISRDGELIFEDGRHRLAIAKLLNLETIPVQVVVRHNKWQKKREKYAANTDRTEGPTHPDILILDSNKKSQSPPN